MVRALVDGDGVPPKLWVACAVGGVQLREHHINSAAATVACAVAAHFGGPFTVPTSLWRLRGFRTKPGSLRNKEAKGQKSKEAKRQRGKRDKRTQTERRN
jgi:hypothetical protein